MTIAVSSVFAERAFRRPMAADVRRRLDEDISIVFRMLNRSDWVREFILGSNVSSDLLMLMSPLGAQSSFILETEEHQEGRLTGSIKMRYLVVPSFTTPDGLSGGAIVTTYARRDHPLHSPSVMATTRIGRYVRDNDTGEWLFLTRNETDNVTRMQWLHSSKSTTRERINLTCDSTLFNKGLFADSILFECHDEEWRPCPQCHAPPEACCSCSTSESALVVPKHPLDLSSVAAAALTEPKSEWYGRVQVSILSNLTKDLRGDVDACMNLRTSFAASQDATLALQMQNLALAERAKSVIPKHVAPPKLLTNGHATGAAAAFGIHATGSVNVLHNSEDNQSVPQPFALSGHGSDMAHLSTGTFSQLMSEMMNGRDDKHFSLDGVVPELISRAEKKDTEESLHHHGQNTQERCLPAFTQQTGSNNVAFDPMSLLMAKQSMEGNTVTGVTRRARNDVVQPVPVSHSLLHNSHNQNQEKQLLQGNHEHQHLVVNPLSVNQDHDTTMLHRLHDVSHGAPVQHTQGHQSQSPHVSPLTRAPVDEENDEDEDDDGGVFHTNTGGQRMTTTKSFETLLGTFMAPHATSAMPSSGVDITSVDNMDIVGSPWVSEDPSSASLQKPTSSLPLPAAQGHVLAQSMPNRVVAPAPQHENPFPPHRASNGISHCTAPLVLSQSNQIATRGVPPKCEHRMFVHSLDSPNGTCGQDLSADALDADESGQSFARLEPRPPGMSAGADRAWMWHMGPRGPFGMAAIAAARERERRAEERRRKNREAAARSNARAKERLERIKGELEMNKDRISMLSQKRRELELQNNMLKQRLAQLAS